MPISLQIRRDQRPPARPDDQFHLIDKLGQQHRQRPERVRTTRPAATQHQTRVAPCAILSLTASPPRDRLRDHAARPCLTA